MPLRPFTNFSIHRRVALLTTALLVGSAGAASGQAGLTSAPVTVSISAVKTNLLSLTINSGAAVSLASLTDNALNTFPTSTSITTAWDLHPSTANVTLVAYFSNAAAALANGANVIPSSRMRGRIGASAFAPFTGNAVGGVGTAGGSLSLFVQSITGFNRTSSRTDLLTLQIDLTGGFNATPGTYSGTLTLRAVTQ